MFFRAQSPKSWTGIDARLESPRRLDITYYLAVDGYKTLYIVRIDKTRWIRAVCSRVCSIGATRDGRCCRFERRRVRPTSFNPETLVSATTNRGRSWRGTRTNTTTVSTVFVRRRRGSNLWPITYNYRLVVVPRVFRDVSCGSRHRRPRTAGDLIADRV